MGKSTEDNAENHALTLGHKGSSTPTTGMPMYTDGQDFGYKIKATIDASKTDTIGIGDEFHGQTESDWWSPICPSGYACHPGSVYPEKGGVPNTMAGMMRCETFENIHDGTRDVLETYAEWERKWAPQWTMLFGAPDDVVWMNTGDVQGYSPNDYANPYDLSTSDSTTFDAAKHAKTEVTFDFAASTRYSPDADSTYEFGYTRMTRSPSLYERYAWSSFPMAAFMNGWFGDLNGYVGNLDLEPEVANTVSATADWRDADHDRWELKVTPYFSCVRGIDRDPSPVPTAYGAYAKESKNLYGVMPFKGKGALTQTISLCGGKLTNAIELQAIAAKMEADAKRLEPTTPAHALTNLRSSYEIRNVRFDLGVENLFDKLDCLPLGGTDDASEKAANGDLNNWQPVPGMERTLYAGMTVKF